MKLVDRPSKPNPPIFQKSDGNKLSIQPAAWALLKRTGNGSTVRWRWAWPGKAFCDNTVPANSFKALKKNRQNLTHACTVVPQLPCHRYPSTKLPVLIAYFSLNSVSYVMPRWSTWTKLSVRLGRAPVFLLLLLRCWIVSFHMLLLSFATSSKQDYWCVTSENFTEIYSVQQWKDPASPLVGGKYSRWVGHSDFASKCAAWVEEAMTWAKLWSDKTNSPKELRCRTNLEKLKCIPLLNADMYYTIIHADVPFGNSKKSMANFISSTRLADAQVGNSTRPTTIGL